MNKSLNVFPGSLLAQMKKPGNEARIAGCRLILAWFPGFFVRARGEPGNTFINSFIIFILFIKKIAVNTVFTAIFFTKRLCL